MPANRILFVLVIAICMSCPLLHATDYEITANFNNAIILPITLNIKDGTAISKTMEVTETFDVKDQRWLHDETEKWVTLEESEDIMKKAKERSQEQLKTKPKEETDFVRWALNPEFEITEEDGAIIFKSGRVDYRCEVTKPKYDATDFYRFARLNSCKKAIVQRRVPPYAELKVLEELEKRKVIPSKMRIEIVGIKGGPIVEMTYKEVVPE